MTNYDNIYVLKMMLAMLDVRYIISDGDNVISADDILVIDLSLYNFRHFLNGVKNIKMIMLYFKYIQEAVPIPTRACHILNPSWVFDKFMALIRPALRKEVADMFQFHSKGSEDLHKYIPKEVLPEEYGGTQGSINDLHTDWMKIFESKRF